MRESKTSFLQRPSFQYCLLMVLGACGIYISLPMDLYPRSTVERIDLVINLVIFVPCSIVMVFSGLLAASCAVSSRRFDEKSRFVKFATLLLKVFGISGLIRADLIHSGPLGLIRRVFGR